MTLGGYSQMHHTTPMVFVRQRVNKDEDDEAFPEGSFAVYVRKIYLRTNGGLSAVAEEQPIGDDDDYISPQYTTVAVRVGIFSVVVAAAVNVHAFNHHVFLFFLRPQINSHDFNAGGVVIDSGTTTTIFKESFEKPFKAAFQKATSFEWTDLGLPLTEKQVEEYPTILLQLEAADPDAGPVPGAAYANNLDKSNPMVSIISYLKLIGLIMSCITMHGIVTVDLNADFSLHGKRSPQTSRDDIIAVLPPSSPHDITILKTRTQLLPSRPRHIGSHISAKARYFIDRIFILLTRHHLS
jgi:hypothetical protein